MKKLFSENADIIASRNGGGMKDIIIQGRHDFEGLSRNGGGMSVPRLTLGGGQNN
jgi:hypothetical protein